MFARSLENSQFYIFKVETFEILNPDSVSLNLINR